MGVVMVVLGGHLGREIDEIGTFRLFWGTFQKVRAYFEFINGCIKWVTPELYPQIPILWWIYRFCCERPPLSVPGSILCLTPKMQNDRAAPSRPPLHEHTKSGFTLPPMCRHHSPWSETKYDAYPSYWSSFQASLAQTERLKNSNLSAQIVGLDWDVRFRNLKILMTEFFRWSYFIILMLIYQNLLIFGTNNDFSYQIKFSLFKNPIVARW